MSRENVGPYDRAILVPETVEDLRAWLDDNDYQIPEATDEKLRPYVELGTAFIAIRLLPDADSSDIVPLHLSFTSSNPAIPIIPTAVAADPDMGLIVQILGPSRAIPLNFRHVTINETAIDWARSGSNYSDVVSQAADEAGGRAFTTDFAGSHEGRVSLGTVSDDVLAEIEATDSPARAASFLFPDTFNRFGVTLDADLQRVFLGTIELPEGVTLMRLIEDGVNEPEGEGDPPEIEGVMWDKADLLRRLREEINAPRTHLAGLFEAAPYLSRLYTTMSPGEMTVDPMFELNADLEDVANIRQATQFVACPNGALDFENATITTPSGLRFRPSARGDDGLIARQAGETVRGQEVIGALRVEQHHAAGQPELIDDRRGAIIADNLIAVGGGGCSCDLAPDRDVGAVALFIGLCLLGRRRRWR